MNSSRSLSVAAAVALALGAGSAIALDKATTVAAIAAGRTLTVAGASASRDSFLTLLNTDLCVASTLDVYRATPTGGQDFRAYSCHTVASGAGATALGGTGATGAADKDIVVYYRAEGGSAWGPYSIAQKNVQGAAFPGVKSLDVSVCSAANSGSPIGTFPTHDCATTGTYSLTNDVGTITAGLVDRPTQLGTADVEPKLFTGSNSPSLTSSKLSAAANVVTNLKNLAYETSYGQVFTLLLNNSGASGGVTNLTSVQVTGIFSGTIVDWCQISTSLAANCTTGGEHPITIVRREPGSGTQVGAGVQFTRAGCGDSFAFLTDHDAPGAADTDFVIELGTTGLLEGKVNTTTESIGINLFKDPANLPQANTHQISIDGVAPSKATAANLTYPYAFESTFTKAAAAELPAGTIPANIAAGLITVSKDFNKVPNNVAVFAIPSGTNPPGSVGAPSTAPVALGTRGGQSCRPFQIQ